MAAGMAAATVAPILFMEGEFRSATVNYWTGVGTISWDGKDWTGTGELLTVGQFDETNDVQAQGTTINLCGVTMADIAEALGELQNFKPGTIWLALLAPDGSIVGDPAVIFRGRLDTALVDDSDPTNPQLALSYESELIDLERPRTKLYTDGDQQALYPGDLGLQYVAALQDQTLVWGNSGS